VSVSMLCSQGAPLRQCAAHRRMLHAAVSHRQRRVAAAVAAPSFVSEDVAWGCLSELPARVQRGTPPWRTSNEQRQVPAKRGTDEQQGPFHGIQPKQSALADHGHALLHSHIARCGHFVGRTLTRASGISCSARSTHGRNRVEAKPRSAPMVPYRGRDVPSWRVLSIEAARAPAAPRRGRCATRKAQRPAA
jgi:hypothetical protein